MLHFLRVFIAVASLVFLSCNGRQALFTRLPPSHTGIGFANNIRETDSLNVFTFEYIYNGGGVGIGDFNNDGLQDVYFAGNEVSSKLYLNRGDLRFLDITEASGTGTRYWCTGVAVIDINADGWKDIYISTAFPDAEKAAPNLLFVNKGLNQAGVPVFQEAAAQVGLNDSAYGTQAAFLDYDRDGDLDVYLCINSRKEQDRNALRIPKADGTGPSQDRLLRNDGALSGGLPSFTDVSRQAGIMAEGWGLGVVVKDINRDGWPDVYVANDFQSNDHLYINNHDGTFTNRIAQYLAHQSHNSMGVDIADCNNDGLEDICVVDMLPEDNLRQKTMFDAIPNDKYATALRMGYQPQFVRNMLQLNNGTLPDSTGTVAFSDISYMAGIAATDWSWSPLWADLDGDGWRDLLITNGYVKDITDLDFAVYASEFRMFGDQQARKKLLEEKAKEIGEVKKKNWLFHNNTNLTFSNKAEEWGLGETSFSNGATYADLDNDGDLDLLMNNLNGEAFVYQNNSRQLRPKDHYLQVKLEGEGANLQGIGAKLHLWCGGKLQYAEQALQRGYLSSVDERIFFGLGNSATIDSLQIEWQSGKKQKLYAVAANRLLVLKEADAKEVSVAGPAPAAGYWLQAASLGLDSAYRHEENDYLDFLYQYTLPHRFSMQGPSLAVADINGDGLDDVYTGGASRHSGYFLVQHAGGFKARPLSVQPEQKRQEETGTLLFDADGDGDEDLYCVAGGNEFGDSAAYADMLLLNDGKGNFSDASAALPNTTASGSCISASDFDHDGDLDLFVGGRNKPHRYPLPDRSYLLRNDSDPRTGAVRFTDVTARLAPSLMSPGMVTAVLWTDYDNDGFADLMLAGEFMPLTLFKNEQGKSLKLVEPKSFAYTNGWYNSLTGADFDNDGDIDYIAGNLGLNSRYRCNKDEPVMVRYHDFNKDGAQDAFLFGYIGGREYPLHTRATMIEQIASIRKKAYYYHQFGRMTYQDLFTSEERKGAHELKAYQMASLYIENKGKGNFVVKPLPYQAQVAPLMGVLPIDVDGDGYLDIVAVGNSYAPEALTGRYDASVGWVLKGDGKGNFQAVSPQVSGFAMRGDARALVQLKQADDTCMLLASENSGPLIAYKLQGAQRSIVLNKTDQYAIYHLRDGKKRKEEFYRGSSYLSQQGWFIIANNSIKGVEIFGSEGRRQVWTQ